MDNVSLAGESLNSSTEVSELNGFVFYQLGWAPIYTAVLQLYVKRTDPKEADMGTGKGAGGSHLLAFRMY